MGCLHPTVPTAPGSRRRAEAGAPGAPSRHTEHRTPAEQQAAMRWAQRLKRIFKVDVETCPNCGRSVKVIASIEDPPVIERILHHSTATISPACGRKAGHRRRSAPAYITEPQKSDFRLHSLRRGPARSARAVPGYWQTNKGASRPDLVRKGRLWRNPCPWERALKVALLERMHISMRRCPAPVHAH